MGSVLVSLNVLIGGVSCPICDQGPES